MKREVDGAVHTHMLSFPHHPRRLVSLVQFCSRFLWKVRACVCVCVQACANVYVSFSPPLSRSLFLHFAPHSDNLVDSRIRRATHSSEPVQNKVKRLRCSPTRQISSPLPRDLTLTLCPFQFCFYCSLSLSLSPSLPLSPVSLFPTSRCFCRQRRNTMTWLWASFKRRRQLKIVNTSASTRAFFRPLAVCVCVCVCEWTERVTRPVESTSSRRCEFLQSDAHWNSIFLSVIARTASVQHDVVRSHYSANTPFGPVIVYSGNSSSLITCAERARCVRRSASLRVARGALKSETSSSQNQSCVSYNSETKSMGMPGIVSSCMKNLHFIIHQTHFAWCIIFSLISAPTPLFLSVSDSDSVLSLLAFVCLFLTHRSGIIHKKYAHLFSIYFEIA